jgi:hypothetical protein
MTFQLITDDHSGFTVDFPAGIKICRAGEIQPGDRVLMILTPVVYVGLNTPVIGLVLTVTNGSIAGTKFSGGLDFQILLPDGSVSSEHPFIRDKAYRFWREDE